MSRRKQTWMAPCLVAVDQSEYWNDSLVAVAGKIKTVYIFDANRVTHCCELTPSYELMPLYYSVENEINEAVFDEINDQMVHEEMFQYMHTYQIDAMDVMRLPKQRILRDVGYDDTLEGVREHYQGNWML